MRYDEYRRLAIEKYPYTEQMTEVGHWNKVDLIKGLAELLFLEKETDSILANETRRQLNSLLTEGVTCFDIAEQNQ